jgi:hypothetical protein
MTTITTPSSLAPSLDDGARARRNEAYHAPTQARGAGTTTAHWRCHRGLSPVGAESATYCEAPVFQPQMC